MSGCKYHVLQALFLILRPIITAIKVWNPEFCFQCILLFVCLFCCFTSQVNIYGHCGTVSSPNHTFSWAGLNKGLTSNLCTYCNKYDPMSHCNWQQPFLNESAEGRRMTVEIISWSISTKVWNRTGIELVTPGSAVRHASVARHVTDCATRPGILMQRFFERKIVNNFLPISFNICFWCSKELSHWDGSFEYPQLMFWLRNKKIDILVHTLN